ncbi:hypothetical protein [Oricola sp.]|uniref:hypothetical protein n=1 Tax=Oricola sp. TaxID=1979950 RepID=UPI003BAA8873
MPPDAVSTQCKARAGSTARRRNLAATLMALALAGVVLAWCRMLGYPGWEWHQKLTVEVETPNGVAVGSAVTEVHWRDELDLLADAPHVHSDVTGEAVVVNLGDDQYLFALLSGAERLALRVFSDRRWPSDTDGLLPLIRDVSKQSKGASRPVEPAAYPRLVTFGDIDDPTSVRRVDPDNLAASFGHGYRLKSITLEITDAPVTNGELAKLFPWLDGNRIDPNVNGGRSETLRYPNDSRRGYGTLSVDEFVRSRR